jgi:hypothetical protein
MMANKYYLRWKAKKLAADPDFFKHEYQRKLALYGHEYSNEHTKAWRKRNPSYHKNYIGDRKEHYADLTHRWRQKNKEKHCKDNVEWMQAHPKIMQAHSIAYYGRLEKGFEPAPLAELCETCPDDDVRKATQRHHPDYEYPQITVSVCRSYHYYLNREQKGKQQTEVKQA